MFDRQQKLEISPEQFAIIEEALHTQSKILNVQASAGGSNARRRLNEVKGVLAFMAAQKPAANDNESRAVFGWFGKTRVSG
ncbi:hypothetical protein SAMN04488523_11238 [Sulfitobacter brevis]|uniref:Uncharacterized protein n=1 Tax=Sulfitobacter brevis TaxID=74348 RepID=A0A1I2EGX1_9RHOB|nr:hypothetical protein [Sulfitobacter brevis]SFE91796.1 hypothetical protein SAMN04488523_11238 [Sulfitobacter brevis]